MAAPTAEFERLILSGKIEHDDHPMLRWMAANVTIETDAAGNIKPSKRKSTERIDGIVAAIMAIARAMLQTGPPKSVYSSHGVLWIDHRAGR